MGKDKKPLLIENVTITDAGAKGKSIAHAPDGRVIFVDNAVPEDIVDILVTKKKKAFYEGTAVKFHQESPLRVVPVCEHFTYCGGCQWQHMNYQSQLHYKQKEVENNLKRLGGVIPEEILPIVGCNKPYFYRNKIEFSFSETRWLTPEEITSKEEIADRQGLGFHIAGAWDKVLDIRKCHLQEDPSNAIRNKIREYALSHDYSFYNPRSHSGWLRTMMIRISSIGEIMLVIQFLEERKEPREQLLNYLLSEFPTLTSLQYIINNKPNDTIYDQEVICYLRDFCINEYEIFNNKRYLVVLDAKTKRIIKTAFWEENELLELDSPYDRDDLSFSISIGRLLKNRPITICGLNYRYFQCLPIVFLDQQYSDLDNFCNKWN